MSIRIKLMITYAVLVLVSAAIIIFSGIGILTKVTSAVSEEILDSTNFNQFINSTIDVLADIRHAQKYEPNKLVDQNFIDELNEALKIKNSSIIAKYSLGSVMTNGRQFSEEFIDQLKPHSFEDRNHENYIKYEDKGFFYIDYTVKTADDSIEYYFISDVTNINNIRLEVVRRMLRGLLFVLLVLLAPLLFIITRDINKPLKTLESGVNHIKNGNLNFELTTKKHNEIGRVIKSFEIMRSRLKISIDNQLKYEKNRKELISNISHDLRTPITSIKGHVEGIRDGVANTPEKLDKYLQVIYQKSEDIDNLINDLFLYSKFDLNKQPLDFNDVPIGAFVSEIVQESALDFNQDHQSMIFNNHLDEDIVLKLDVIQMKRVMVNIIQNSMKYMDKDRHIIEITLESVDDNIRIEIADNGEGIKPEHLEMIFDRFYRVDESRNPETGGTGLGLAIAKQIILRHGGKLYATSDYKKGTTMHIELSKEVKND